MLIRRTPYPGASAVKLGYKREEMIDNKKVIGRPCLETSVKTLAVSWPQSLFAADELLLRREELKVDQPTASTM